MGKQARTRALRRTIKDLAKEKNTTVRQIAEAVYSNAGHSKRSSDEALAAWYFIRKGFMQ
jgi:hypothetical protein